MNDNEQRRPQPANLNAAHHAGMRVDVVGFKPFRRSTAVEAYRFAEGVNGR